MNQKSTEDLGQFKAYLRLISVDPARNRFHYYSLAWQPGLWGDGALVRCWGRIGTKGRSVAVLFQHRNSAQQLIEAIVKRRLQRGYVPS
jgi:predicted DNA-binding WGR domain protein